MKKIAYAAFTSAAAMALAACGSSKEAADEAQTEDVEAPAEGAVADEGMAEEATDAATDEAADAEAAAPAEESTGKAM
jgi:hypothetical protein